MVRSWNAVPTGTGIPPRQTQRNYRGVSRRQQAAYSSMLVKWVPKRLIGIVTHCATHYYVYTIGSINMPTNPDIDDRLIDEAKKLGRHRTKRDTVNPALDEYIRRRKQQQIVSLF